MTQEEIEQLNARIAQMRMSIGDSPITMGGQIANTPLNIDLISPMSDPYADPRAKSFDGQERAVDAQRAYANSIRGKGTPQGKMVGQGKWATYQQPNWGENLEGVVNKLAGGYMAGQADRADEAIDVERGLAKSAALAAEDAEKQAALALAAGIRVEDNNFRDLEFDQRGDQYTATNNLTREKIAATARAQNYTENAGAPEPYQSVIDGTVMTAVKTPTGEIFEYDKKGGRGNRLDASTWIPLQNAEDTGSTSTVANQMALNAAKQDDKMTLAEFNQDGRERLAKLNDRLRNQADISAEERAKLIEERIHIRDLEREAKQETGESAIAAQEAITSGSAVLRRDNMYAATGANPAAFFADLTGYDLTEGGDIGATQRMIAILGSQGAAKDFARLNLKPISDYEANYIINDLNVSSKDQPKSILTYTMQYNDMYKQALADGEKDGAIALGAAEQVMNQRYDDQVILGSLKNKGNMTMGLTEMKENGLPVEEVYQRLRKKLKDGSIDTREKQALLSLSQAYE